MRKSSLTASEYCSLIHSDAFTSRALAYSVRVQGLQPTLKSNKASSRARMTKTLVMTKNPMYVDYEREVTKNASFLASEENNHQMFEIY